MQNTKRTLLNFAALICIGTTLQGVTFTSFAAVNAAGDGPTLTGGTTAFLISAGSNNTFDFLSGGPTFSINAGLEFSLGQLISGTDDYVFAANASQVFGSNGVISGNASFDLSDNAGLSGSSFGLLFFDGTSSASVTSLGGDGFGWHTDSSWVIPTSNSASESFGSSSTFAQLSGVGHNGSVVPEPSSFALIAGCFGLALAVVRRRSRCA